MINSNRKKFHNSLIYNNKERFCKLMKGEIKKDNHDENNYHYLGLIKFVSGIYKKDGKNDFLDSLRENKLWVSSPGIFNDPFDCMININLKKVVSEEVTIFLEQVFGSERAKNLLRNSKNMQKEALDNLEPELFKLFRSKTEKANKGLFVSCFSELSNLNSILMWSHYANKHEGFCIEYDYREINKLRIKDNTIIPVLYSNKIDIRPPKNETKEELLRYQLSIAFTKSKEWEYEKEWRLLEINEEQKDKNGFLISFVKPKRIYLGCRVSDKLREDVLKYCRSNKVELYKMELESGTFIIKEKKLKD